MWDDLAFDPEMEWEYQELLEDYSLKLFNKVYEDLDLDEKILVIKAAMEAVD